MAKLTAREVDNLTDAGKYEDGDGLRLEVKPSGTKSWVLRFQLHGKRREMGLGRYPDVTLKHARILAAEKRAMILDKRDPIVERDKLTAQKHEEVHKAQLKAVTFQAVAEEYVNSQKAGWKNAKHAWQWGNTLQRFVFPVIGKLPPADVTTEHVLKILKPIWQEKTETASRVRSRLELILDSAKAQQLRQGDNPARWRGHLDKLLPAISKIQKVKHHPSMSYSFLPEFWQELKLNPSISAKALQLLILTATRTSETLNAKWNEIDFSLSIWIIPADRMKMGREHRVPLSTEAVEILQSIPQVDGSEYIFPGVKAGKPLSNLSMVMLMRRMGYGCNGDKGDSVPHGFRSTFRDWAGEVSNFPGDVAEMALAHTIANKVEAAYRRGDLLAKRAIMMQEWADYIVSVH